MYYQQYMLAHICHAYTGMSMYTLMRLHIEMGPTQTSEGKEWLSAR